MFYCDDCAKRLRWPQTIVASRGPCEVCGINTTCNDYPSSQLSPSTAFGEEWAELHDHQD